MTRRWLFFMAALAGGCFNPDLGHSPFACGDGDSCPPDYTCKPATGLCMRETSVDGGSRPDASGAFGQFTVTWGITVNEETSNCGVVGAVTFELSALRDNANEADVFRYPCSSMNGITDPIPTGKYKITIRLLDSSNSQLNQNVSVEKTLKKDDVISLGNYVFAFQMH